MNTAPTPWVMAEWHTDRIDFVEHTIPDSIKLASPFPTNAYNIDGVLDSILIRDGMYVVDVLDGRISIEHEFDTLCDAFDFFWDNSLKPMLEAYDNRQPVVMINPYGTEECEAYEPRTLNGGRLIWRGDTGGNIECQVFANASQSTVVSDLGSATTYTGRIDFDSPDFQSDNYDHFTMPESA